MTTLQKTLSFIFLILFFSSCRLVVGTIGYTKMTAERYNNKKIPLAFELPDENGNLVKLSDFKDKVIYIDFWTTWCSPCLAEIPYSDSLQQRFNKYDDIVFINIAADTAITKWKSLIKERNIKGINLIDTSLEIENTFEIDGNPTYLLIGKDQQLLGHDIAYPSEKGLVDFQIYKARDGMKSKKVLSKMFRSKGLFKKNAEWFQNHMKEN